MSAATKPKRQLCSCCGGYYETEECPCVNRSRKRQRVLEATGVSLVFLPVSKTQRPAFLKLSFEAGRLIRGRVVSKIKTYCFRRDLTCEVEEDKGFWESTFRIKISGPQDKIDQARSDIARWSEYLQEEQREK